MSKRITPARAAASKRAAFSGQRASMAARRGKSAGLPKGEREQARFDLQQWPGFNVPYWQVF